MKRALWSLFLLIVGVFFLAFFTTLMLQAVLDSRGGNELESANVAVIEIDGVVRESMPVLEELDRLEDNPQLKALIVRLNSPGGAVGSSQEIFYSLRSVREKMPVVVSMGNVSASGGLYISLGADHIIAMPGSITGSMGVITSIPNFSKLLEELYVEPVTIRSGELKDPSNPMEPRDPEGEEFLKGMIHSIFQQFRADVQNERDLSEETMELLSDGRVVHGADALELGLIDGIGTFFDAVRWAEQEADLEEAELAYLSRQPKGLVERVLERSLQTLWSSLEDPGSWLLYAFKPALVEGVGEVDSR